MVYLCGIENSVCFIFYFICDEILNISLLEKKTKSNKFHKTTTTFNDDCSYVVKDCSYVVKQ